jgi:hypothetical protein
MAAGVKVGTIAAVVIAKIKTMHPRIPAKFAIFRQDKKLADSAMSVKVCVVDMLLEM